MNKYVLRASFYSSVLRALTRLDSGCCVIILIMREDRNKSMVFERTYDTYHTRTASSTCLFFISNFAVGGLTTSSIYV